MLGRNWVVDSANKATMCPLDTCPAGMEQTDFKLGVAADCITPGNAWSMLWGYV